MASFDALASLAEDAGEMPPPMEAGTIAADIAAPSPEVVLPSSDAADEQPPDDRLEPTMAPAAELAAAPEPSAELAPPTPTAPAALPEPRLHEISSGRRSGPWLVGGALALAALSMQAAVHFRATLAARLPEARPLLAALCEPIGCALEPPRQIDLIEIESSDLTPDPQTPGHLQLVATLRKKASFAGVAPSRTTLTDVSIARCCAGHWRRPNTCRRPRQPSLASLPVATASSISTTRPHPAVSPALPFYP
jgi:hypothetical protein